MGLQQKLDALEAETYDTTPEPPTVEDEAERLLSYWHLHGNNPEAVTKWAVADLLAFVRLAAPDAAAHYGQAPWEIDPTAALEPAPVWPENDAERAAFADWQREVGEGDTTLGFRDWLAANAEIESDDDDASVVDVRERAMSLADEWLKTGSLLTTRGRAALELRAILDAPQAREDRTVWRLTAADLDDYAGRTLSDDELDTVASCLDNSTVGDCVHGAVDQL